MKVHLQTQLMVYDRTFPEFTFRYMDDSPHHPELWNRWQRRWYLGLIIREAFR